MHNLNKFIVSQKAFNEEMVMVFIIGMAGFSNEVYMIVLHRWAEEIL